MTCTLKIAAIQMDAMPAPTAERLARAADLVAEAATSGAKLVVLPELFNTGYEYHDRNYDLAETIDGPTVSWMKTQAADHQIHLAGSLLLRDGDDIFNAAFLVAPSGQLWRYDKHYPWAFERAYFRGSKDGAITIAETEVGRLGMMICWDSAHPELWQRYAGQVDAMVVMSCPPKMSASELVFPDGFRVNNRQLGPIFKTLYTDQEFFPGADIELQTAWLGVPVVQTAGGGKMRSKLPRPFLALMTYLAARPDLWRRLRQAREVHLETGYDPQTKVLNGAGQVLSRVESNGDGLTLAEVTLPDTLPQPSRPQPKMHTHLLGYWISDKLAPALTKSLYQCQVKRNG